MGIKNKNLMIKFLSILTFILIIVVLFQFLKSNGIILKQKTQNNLETKTIIDKAAESATYDLSIIFASTEIPSPTIFKNIDVEANVTSYYMELIKNLSILINSKKNNFITDDDFHRALATNYDSVKEFTSVIKPQYESAIFKFMLLSKERGAIESYFYNESYSQFNSTVVANFWGNHGFFEKENQTFETFPWTIKAIYIIETVRNIQSSLPSNVIISPDINPNIKAKYIVSTFWGTHNDTLFGEENDTLTGIELKKQLDQILTPTSRARLNELLSTINDNNLSDNIKVYLLIK